MKLSLFVLTSGKQEGKLIEIKLPQFLIGRDPQCHLRPASPLISKRHCAFIQRDEKAYIRDFDSTNGTLVNDEPLKGERELHHDDQVKIGPIVFSVRLEASAPVAGKTPAPATKPVGTKTPIPATRPVTSVAKPAPAKNDTPAPATIPAEVAAAAKAAAAKAGSPDDDIAAMLLSLDDGEAPASPAAGGDGVPDGSTVFDLKVPAELAGAGAPGAAKPGEQKPAAKQGPGDTRSAAARILEKMTKRPRS